MPFQPRRHVDRGQCSPVWTTISSFRPAHVYAAAIWALCAPTVVISPLWPDMRRTRSLDANSTANGEPGLGDVGRGSGSALDNKVDAAFGLANRYLAMTRSQVVADELVKDGVDPGKLRQVVIGQSGSEDASVAVHCWLHKSGSDSVCRRRPAPLSGSAAAGFPAAA